MDPFRELGRTLLVLGALLVSVGALLYIGGKLPFRLGRLPGDIVHRGNTPPSTSPSSRVSSSAPPSLSSSGWSITSAADGSVNAELRANERLDPFLSRQP